MKSSKVTPGKVIGVDRLPGVRTPPRSVGEKTLVKPRTVSEFEVIMAVNIRSFQKEIAYSWLKKIFQVIYPFRKC